MNIFNICQLLKRGFNRCLTRLSNLLPCRLFWEWRQSCGRFFKLCAVRATSLALVLALAFTLTFTLALPLGWAGGDSVNNGGGIAEKTILFVYSNVERYSFLCLKTALCKLDQRQKNILTQILSDLEQERKNDQQIIFISEKKAPGFFIIDGEVKIAKTGTKVGSPIYINLDLLYLKNTLGVFESLSAPEALALLIHEFGHHHGYSNHTELDLLGVKVAISLQQNSTSTPILPWNKNVNALIINNFESRGFPDVILNIKDELTDITPLFKAKLKCPLIRVPIPIVPIDDPAFKWKPPLRSVYHNIYWEKFSLSEQEGNFSILGNLSNFCDDKDTPNTVDKDYKVRIQFKVQFNEATQSSKLDSSSISITQFYDPWYKIIKAQSRP